MKLNRFKSGKTDFLNFKNKINLSYVLTYLYDLIY